MIAGHITPYNCTGWEAVLSAFRHFLDSRQQYSRKHKQAADDAIASRTPYTKAPKRYVPLTWYAEGETHPPRKQMNLDTHANGQPILWRHGKPCPVAPVRLQLVEQPEHIRLQLEIMQAAA